jgi:hypothetical protein
MAQLNIKVTGVSKVFLRPDQNGQYLIQQFSDLSAGSGGFSDSILSGFRNKNIPQSSKS